jgi:hypothetical protein
MLSAVEAFSTMVHFTVLTVFDCAQTDIRPPFLLPPLLPLITIPPNNLIRLLVTQFSGFAQVEAAVVDFPEAVF